MRRLSDRPSDDNFAPSSKAVRLVLQTRLAERFVVEI